MPRSSILLSRFLPAQIIGRFFFQLPSFYASFRRDQRKKFFAFLFQKSESISDLPKKQSIHFLPQKSKTIGSLPFFSLFSLSPKNDWEVFRPPNRSLEREKRARKRQRDLCFPAQKRKHFLPPSLPAQKQSIFEESAKKKKTCGEISVETHRRDRRRLCFRFWTGKIILGGQNGRELGEKNGEKAQKSKAFFFQTFLHTSLFSGSAIKIKSEASAHSVFLPFCYPLWGK